MREIAEEAWRYLQDNLLVMLAIALLAGVAAFKTVVYEKRGNPILFFVVGLFGTFLGQFAILYFGLKEILDQIAEFRLFFDLLAAYIGSFVVISFIHFLKSL
jgi:uncharacterized membrane protein YeaQ/YmgE (transglycosylase-associated protein family)